MLNRGVLIVRPKKPYLDWAAGLDDSSLVPPVDGEQTVYLIPTFEDDNQADAVLKKVYAEVFEDQLFGWDTEESCWPAKRTFAMFKRWFHVELHSVVEDLCETEIVDEDDV